MIEVYDLTKTYKMGTEEVHALQGVTLKVEQGDFVAIMGASGSGKSTLLHVLGLLDTPDSGSYRLMGREVATLQADDLAVLRSRTLGFIFQQFNLLPRTTALENASLPLLYFEGSDAGDPVALLDRVGLSDRLLHKPNEMSGGQQQRVAIARSLVNKPRVVLADEPTGNLDSQSSEEIMGILESLNREGITVIMVTHEPDIATHASRIVRMKDGKVVSDERTKPLPKAVAGGGEAKPGPAKSHLWRFSNYMKQAIRALSSNKVRTSLSILGILIGVAAVIAMLALGTGAQKSIEQQLSSLGSNLLMLRGESHGPGPASQGSQASSRLTLDDVRDVAGLTDVKSTAPEVSGRVQVVNLAKNWNTQVTGTSPSYAAMRAAVPAVGRFFTEAEVTQRAKVVVLGMTVVTNLFGSDNPIGAFIKINRVTFQVIGVLPAKGATGFRDQDDVIIVPVTTAMYRLLGKQFVDVIDVEAVSGDKVQGVQDALTQLMRKKHRLAANADDDFRIMNMADLQATLTSTSKVMTTLLASIAAISLLVGGIGIMNIMLVSVTERTREIGLRKALGARGRDILSQFLIEAVVVSLTGGAGGILLGFAISTGISVFAQWAVSVTAGSVLLAVFFSAGIGVAFGLWPARKAADLNPIDALRYE